MCPMGHTENYSNYKYLFLTVIYVIIITNYLASTIRNKSTKGTSSDVVKQEDEEGHNCQQNVPERPSKSVIQSHKIKLTLLCNYACFLMQR